MRSQTWFVSPLSLHVEYDPGMTSYLADPAFEDVNAGPRGTDSLGRPTRCRAPSAKQIEMRAAVIQASWSARERRMRAAYCLAVDYVTDVEPPFWTPPVIKMGDVDAART